MRRPSFTRQFRRDIKRMQKRGKDMSKIKQVMSDLIDGKTLAPRFRGHVLISAYRGRRECHIEPDWLLIYKLEADEIIFERTGTHSDLFR